MVGGLLAAERAKSVTGTSITLMQPMGIKAPERELGYKIHRYLLSTVTRRSRCGPSNVRAGLSVWPGAQLVQPGAVLALIDHHGSGVLGPGLEDPRASRSLRQARKSSTRLGQQFTASDNRNSRTD